MGETWTGNKRLCQEVFANKVAVASLCSEHAQCTEARVYGKLCIFLLKYQFLKDRKSCLTYISILIILHIFLD